MSVSRWAYSPLKCDDGYCVGDCDMCYKSRIADDDQDYMHFEPSKDDILEWLAMGEKHEE